MKRTEKLLCAHLFANEPRPLPKLANETGESLVGYWKGFHTNGQQTEMMVKHITRGGESGAPAQIHHRAPVLVLKDDVDAWPDPESDVEAIRAVLARPSQDEGVFEVRPH